MFGFECQICNSEQVQVRDVPFLFYHLGCTKYEVCMMSGTLISSVHYFIETGY